MNSIAVSTEGVMEQHEPSLESWIAENPDAESRLRAVGFSDLTGARRNLVDLGRRGLSHETLMHLLSELALLLPATADPDRALTNFDRLLTNVDDGPEFVSFLSAEPHSLRVLLQLFASSQFFGDLLINRPEHFQFLWRHGHEELDPQQLKQQLIDELQPEYLENDDRIYQAIRLHRQREILRIGYRDIAQGEPLESITRSISDLADALAQAALHLAWQRVSKKVGQPLSDQGKPAQMFVLGFGKLGGRELNYSSDIDLVILYDSPGQTDGHKSISNDEFFTRVTRDFVRMLSINTANGQAYRVDLRLRPHGDQGPLVFSTEQALLYYERHGRTWERQALLKARPIAGSLELGDQFLQNLESFIFRKYLNYVEINEIKDIKRRIESKSRGATERVTNLKSGPGGIRDIEFVTQFLQLLHGPSNPAVRSQNTLIGLSKLAEQGFLHDEELVSMETAYRFLRKAEHRLQFMFDLQTHRIPDQMDALDILALRLGYKAQKSLPRPGQQFLDDWDRISTSNRRILQRLMLNLFPESPDAKDSFGEPETDLILDPDPSTKQIENVLGKYGFSNLNGAYKNLMQLAHEEVPFLSSMRCRHFLASVAPRLLEALGDAPDPDMALVNLEKVTASLGAKGVLWESFSVTPSLLNLYVTLCAQSQFLSEILINNPGMIDEVLDALAIDHRPTIDDRRQELQELIRNAVDPEMIMFSFKNTGQLEIGLNDLLGRRQLREVNRGLTELAEVILGAITQHEYNALVEQYGPPGPSDLQSDTPAGFVILGLGKFGGNELGYHSDLDLILIYEKDGTTQKGGTKKPIDHLQFFTSLAQRIAKVAGQLGPLGRLYQVDMRLRPGGRSSSLVVSLPNIREYFENGKADLWERQMLTRGRVVFGQEFLAGEVHQTIRHLLQDLPWKKHHPDDVFAMRRKLQDSRTTHDLKRGSGGIMDIEFAVQALQLSCGRDQPSILTPNVWDALDAIEKAQLWDGTTLRIFREGYTFLRSVESRLRIVSNLQRDDLPNNDLDLRRLALRLGYSGPRAVEQLKLDLKRHTNAVRGFFLARVEETRLNAN